jgi:hypothetical protein
MSVTEPAAAEAEVAARIEYLVEHITDLEKSKTREYRGSNRQSVQSHYQRQIDRLMSELVELLPEPEPEPEPTPVRQILAQINRLIAVYENQERPMHVRCFALVGIAKLELEQQAIDGTPPSISLEAAERHYTEALAEEERLKTAFIPPMGGAHITTRDGRNFNQQHHRMQRETEIVSDPVMSAVHARKANFAAQAALNQHQRFGGQADNGPIPRASAAPFDFNSRGPSFTKPASLSGRTR